MEPPKPKKSMFSVSNIVTILFAIFIMAVFIFPSFKAIILQGLMKAGLFRPQVSNTIKPTTPANQWKVLFKNSKGELLDENLLKGKVAFINSWATWCPPCIAEMPSINDLFKKYKDDSRIVFLMIDADGNLEKANKFMTDKNFDLPVYSLQSGAPKDWFESSLPTTVVLDKKGNIVFRHVGIANYNTDGFKNFIEKLINM